MRVCVACFFLQPITDDDADHLSVCLQALAERTPLMLEIFTQLCRDSLQSMLRSRAEDRKQQEQVSTD